MPSYIVHSLVMYGDEMNKNVTEKKKDCIIFSQELSALELKYRLKATFKAYFCQLSGA